MGDLRVEDALTHQAVLPEQCSGVLEAVMEDLDNPGARKHGLEPKFKWSEIVRQQIEYKGLSAKTELARSTKKGLPKPETRACLFGCSRSRRQPLPRKTRQIR